MDLCWREFGRSITHFDVGMESGLSTVKSTYGEANTGWGPSSGASGSHGDDGSFGGLAEQHYRGLALGTEP